MRSIRCLGLAFVAALVLPMAIGAGSAAASRFSADITNPEGPVDLIGETASTHYVHLPQAGEVMSCNGILLEEETTTPTEAIDFGWTSNGTCKHILGSSPLQMNGCRLIFHAGQKQPNGTSEGAIDIGPSGCGPITTKVVYCPVSIPAQNDLPVTYENVGKGENATVDATLHATQVEYVTTNPAYCSKTGTFKDGYWSGDFGVLARNQYGENVEFRTTSDLGLYRSGENIEAEGYPAQISGLQNAADKFSFTTNTGVMDCESAAFNSKIAGATKEVSLSGQFSGCAIHTILGDLGATVNMRSCSYLVQVSGSLGVKCSVEGDKIEINDIVPFITCKLAILPQTGLKTLGISNTGTGIVRKVVVDSEVKGIKYTESGGACANSSGTFENGALDGSLTLSGSE